MMIRHAAADSGRPGGGGRDANPIAAGGAQEPIIWPNFAENYVEMNK